MITPPTKSSFVSALALGLLLVASASAASEAEIHRILQTRVDLQNKATGIVVGMVEAKRRHVVAYGSMSLAKKRPVDGDTVFGVGSLTKVFTALLLSEMLQSGEVALDDPISKYLPAEVHLPDPPGRPITLADLATHTSGLPLRPGNLASPEAENRYAGYSVAQLHEFLESFVPTQEPGTHYEYSNVGYGLLGELLARRAGKSFAELLRTRITEPLGLHDTGLELTPGMKNRLATGYDQDLQPAPIWDFGVLAPAGALFSTTNDLLTFLEALLGNRKSDLLPAMKAMLETRRPGGMPPSNEIALAWNFLSDHGHEIAWKNGNVGGYRAILGYDRKARLGLVALANAQSAVGADDIALHLLDSSQPIDLSIPKPHHEISLGASVLERYVGRYRYSPTDVITVIREGDHLFVSGQGFEKIELFPESERDFFFKAFDAQINFVVSPNESASVAIWRQAGQSQRGERIRAETSAKP